MKLPKYEMKSDESLMIYDFVSDGVKGEIHKRIKFSETSLKNFYNLAFGDLNPLTKEISDSIITNNGDTEREF